MGLPRSGRDSAVLRGGGGHSGRRPRLHFTATGASSPQVRAGPGWLAAPQPRSLALRWLSAPHLLCSALPPAPILTVGDEGPRPGREQRLASGTWPLAAPRAVPGLTARKVTQLLGGREVGIGPPDLRAGRGAWVGTALVLPTPLGEAGGPGRAGVRGQRHPPGCRCRAHRPRPRECPRRPPQAPPWGHPGPGEGRSQAAEAQARLPRVPSPQAHACAGCMGARDRGAGRGPLPDPRTVPTPPSSLRLQGWQWPGALGGRPRATSLLGDTGTPGSGQGWARRRPPGGGPEPGPAGRSSSRLQGGEVRPSTAPLPTPRSGRLRHEPP